MEYNCDRQKLKALQAEYQDILERLEASEKQGVIDAFDKRILIELSVDVIHEIAKKYEHVQKEVGDMMRGRLIETEAKIILNQGIYEAKKETAVKMLQAGKLTIEEISEYAGFTVEEVKKLAGV